MVVTPGRAFTVRDALALGDIVPTVGSMVDRMQQQALVFGICGQVRLVEQSVCDGKPGLAIAGAVTLVAFSQQVVAEAKQSLPCNSCRGAVHRFPPVERVGRF